MKIALVHDWLRVNAGSEKVIRALCDIYEEDDLDLYTLFDSLSEHDRQVILGEKQLPVKVSPLQYFPFIKNIYRYLLPIMPSMIQRFKLDRRYEYVLSSSHAVAKGFQKEKGLMHICYCHTPMRYIWDLYEEYYQEAKCMKSVGKISTSLYEKLINYLRKWDLESAKNVDFFIANSENVRRRIEKHYQKPAKVIYPPVRTDVFTLSLRPRQNFYLCVGRFVPYKKVDLIVRAFKEMPEQKLMLIGDGYDMPKIKKMIKHIPNVILLGYQSDEVLIQYMQQAKACVFAAREDFGIMCVEAQSCGTPVLALREGGYIETVTENVTGYFFDDQTEESIIRAVQQFEENPLKDHLAIRKHAEQFSTERFRKEMKSYIHDCILKFNGQKSNQELQFEPMVAI